MWEWITDDLLRQQVEGAILLWALVAARVMPIVQFTPYLGGKAAPQTVRLAISVALAALVAPIIWQTDGAAILANSSALAIAALLLKELMLGAMFGFVASLVFESTRIAGQLIDNARGQTQSLSFAPQLPERVSVSANYLFQLNIALFLAIGGHHVAIGALVRSFIAIPPHAFPITQDALPALTLGLVRLTADALSLGLLLAFPVIAATLLADLCLALINRSAPQVQVFFLGMPAKALLGVAMLLLTAHIASERVIEEALASLGTLDALLRSLGPMPQGGAP